MDWFANFGMREWLIFGGILLVLLVLVDGFRRMRSERKEGLKMSLGMGGGFPEDTGQDPNETYGAENQIRALEELRPKIIGADPFKLIGLLDISSINKVI